MESRAVFLDRDGTLIEEVGYATRPEQIRILGGVARALARLAGAGYKLVVVTNQSGIARGFLTEDDLNRFHQALDDQLGLLGARVDVYYTCPHHPDPAEVVRPELAVECQCRKPKPGLILQAAHDLGLDLAKSWLVGDTWRDIEAGQAAGIRTIKLPTAASLDGPRPPHVETPTAEAASLERAADIILNYRTAAQEPAASPAPPAPEIAATAPVAPSPQVAPRLEPAPPDPAAAAEAAPAEVARLLAPPPVAPAPYGSLRDEVPPPDRDAEAIALEEVGREQAPEEVEAAIEPPVEPELAAAPPDVSAPSAAPPDVPEPAIEPPDAAPAATCARCGQVVAVADLVSGAAGRRGGFLLCAACLPHHPPDTDAAIPDSCVGLLRESLLELRRIGRREQSTGLSLLRMLAYLAQAAALFCGIVMVIFSTDKATYVQVAVFLQLLVLTLLLLERRS